MASPADLEALARKLDRAEAEARLDAEWDSLLEVVRTPAELIRLIEVAEPGVTAARACYRTALRVGGGAPEHARWFLAGAFALEGLDDVAHALEPRQQETGFVKRAFAEHPPHAG